MWIYGALFIPLVTATIPVSEQLSNATEFYCKGVNTSASWSHADQTMLDSLIGETNYVRKFAFDTECTEVTTCLSDNYRDMIQTWLRVATAFIFALFFIVLWLILGCCACCRCCRRSPCCCCCKERAYPTNFSKCKILTLMILAGLFAVGLIVDVIYSSHYATRLNDGGKGLVCEAFRLASESVNGANWTVVVDATTIDHTFLGTKPLGEAVDSISDMLAENSTEITAILTTIDNTVELDNSITTFLEYLNLMNDNLGAPGNLQVGPYQCTFCQACCSGGDDSLVAQAQVVFNNSLASAVQSLRTSVEDKLTGSGLDNIRTSVNQTKDVVSQLRSRIETDLGQRLLDQRPTIDRVTNALSLASIVLVASIGLPALFLLINILVAFCCSKRASFSDPASKPQNPCHASCGWCISFLYAFILMFVGGLLIIVGYFEASICDMTSNMDNFWDDIYFRLDSVIGSDNPGGVSFHTIVDTCFKTNGTGDILSAVHTDGPDSQTVREVLLDALNLTSEFDSVFNQTNDIPSLIDNEVLVQMFDSWTNYGGIYMINVSTMQDMAQNTTLNPQVPPPPNYAAIIKLGLGSRPECSVPGVTNLTVSLVGTSIQASLEGAGYTFPPSDEEAFGFNNFHDYAVILNDNNFTFINATDSCPYIVTDVNAALPYSALAGFKADVLVKEDYQCDTLVPAYDQDTGRVTFTRNPTACTFEEFKTYMSDLQGNVTAAVVAIDTAQEITLTALHDEVESVVIDDLLPPVYTIINGTDCQFIMHGWTGIYEALCWEQTPGLVGIAFTMVGLASLGFLAMIIQFVVWRHLKDNLCLWQDIRREVDTRRTSIRDTVTRTVNLAPVVQTVRVQPGGNVAIVQ